MNEAITVTTPAPATFGTIGFLAMLTLCFLFALAACDRGPLK